MAMFCRLMLSALQDGSIIDVICGPEAMAGGGGSWPRIWSPVAHSVEKQKSTKTLHQPGKRFQYLRCCWLNLN